MLNRFEESTLKQIVRLQIRNALMERFKSDERPRIFTLPGTSFHLERELSALYPNAVMHGVERDTTKFDIGSKLISQYGLPFRLQCCSDLDYWQSNRHDNEHKFDLIWLDYCGAWSEDKRLSLDAVFSKPYLRFNETSNPILGLTLCANRGRKSLEEVKKLAKKEVSANGDSLAVMVRSVGLPLAINLMAHRYGMSAIPKIVIRYRDRLRARHAAPMLTTIFEVKNGVKFFSAADVQALDMLQDNVTKIHKPKL